MTDAAKMRPALLGYMDTALECYEGDEATCTEVMSYFEAWQTVTQDVTGFYEKLRAD